MEVIFITGSSGCGKSRKLYDKLSEESVQNPGKRFFLVVPEQFTMQAQKNIVELSPRHGSFNIDIVSFNRLAYRVFEELGVSLLTTINDTGKNMILRKVIDENKNRLEVIRPKDTQGFVSEIKSVISELLQYSVTPQMLSEACGRIGGDGINHNERLKRKLKDIMVIYNAFREYISQKYITTEEITEILCGCVDRSQLVCDAVFAFDGFTGFTPVQYRLIELLFDKVAGMYFTITLPENADRQLFDMSYEMMRRLGECADRNHVGTKREHIGGDVPCRFLSSPELAHLEKNLFRETDTYTHPADRISVYSALGKKAEVQYVAAGICRLVAMGYRYKQIGVIASSMDEYRELIANIFAENDIPVFMDNKRSILANPAVEYIRATLQIIEKDYSYESVFRLLKGYMSPIGLEQVDVFENYVLALGIRGHNRYNEPFRRKFPSRREVDMEMINETRKALCELLEPLWEVFHNKESRVSDYIAVLNDFLDNSHVYERLDELKDRMEQLGNASLVKEYGQSYADIIELLEQTESLLGDEHMDIRHFSDVLDAGFSEIKVGIIPPTVDMVMVGDVERTRLDHVAALFFVGVNEGLVPQVNNNHGLFSEAERELLESVDLEMSPTCRQKAYMQNFYLYLLLTKPSDKLIFTVNREGKPSKLIAEIKRMFPGAVYESDETVNPINLIYNNTQGLRYIYTRLGEGESLSGEENVLLALLMKDEKNLKSMKELACTALRSVTDETITRTAAKLLYGERLTGSVSRMETYASCAFAHFMKYGLELEERRLYEIGAADLGTLFHEALKEYSMRLASEKLNFATVDEGKRSRYIKEAVEYSMTDYYNSVFYDSSRNEYMREKILKMLERTAWALGEQIKAGSFVPVEFEKSFVFEKDGIQIRGKIDRIDYADFEDKSYVKIIDYKSGKKTLDLGRLYDGLQLQLMVYLESLSHDSIPTAALYFNIDNPVVDYETDMNVDDALLQTFKPQGIVNGELTSIQLLDSVTKSGKSSYIPIAYNKDGSLSKTSQATTESRLRLLGDYAVNRMSEFGKEISEGNVAPSPYPDSCDYCPYGMICGFGVKDKGCSYRKPSKLKNDDESFKLFAERLKKDGQKLD